jgi:hypothetical protein
MNTNQQAAKSWITDSAILIALVTAAAYFLTLRYEAGMCNYFKIPIYFVSLNPPLVMFRSAKFIYMIFVVSALVILLFNIFEYCQKNPGRYAPFIIIPLLVVFLLQVIFNIRYEADWLELGTAIFMTLVMMGILIYHLRNAISADFYYRLLNYGPILLFIAIFWLGSSLFYEIGSYMAKQEDEYHVINESLESPKLVVLRMYGDYLITAPFDPETQEVKKDLYILKISEKEKAQLTAEKVGSLKVKP